MVCKQVVSGVRFQVSALLLAATVQSNRKRTIIDLWRYRMWSGFLLVFASRFLTVNPTAL